MLAMVRGWSRRVCCAVAAGILVLCCATVEARTFVCESVDGQPRYCRTDTRGGVRLIRQLSKSKCYEGRTWGYDRGGVWVTDGCRAKFEIGGYSAAPYGYGGYDNEYRPREDRRHWHGPRRVTCESWGNRLNYCRAPVGNGQVEVEKQLSDTRCRLGKNWGWDGGGIWVKNGCRAVFSIY